MADDPKRTEPSESKEPGRPADSPGDKSPDSGPDQGGDKADDKGPDQGGEADAQALGDEDHASTQRAIRDDVQDGVNAFGLRESGVYVTADAPVFNGAVVGGDATFVSTIARTVVEQISTNTVSQIDAWFVRPEGFDQLKSTLDDRHLIVLRVQRRWGATTLALHLLSSRHKVFELRTDAELSSLRVNDIPPGGGVLLDGLNPSQAAELRERDLQKLIDALPGVGSQVVVLVDRETRIGDPAVARNVVEVAMPPASKPMVMRHLARALPDRSGSELEELLVEPRLAELFLDITPQEFDAQQLAELARDIADMTRGQVTVDGVIDRFHLRSGQGIGEWFDQLTEAQFATVVSIAALHGMAYDSISSAAASLEGAFAEVYAERAGKRTRETRQTRLTAARAALGTVTRRTRYGPAQIQVATFLDSSLPARVLEHVWNEYDNDRDMLLAWLRSISTDPSGTVRIRAATAIGYLACLDFDKVRREVIVGWAGSANSDERERAVAALAVPARHPRTRGLVFSLVADWCARKTWSLRITAGRALGTAVGEVIPGGPDVMLADLAEGAGPALSIAIGDSMAELLLNASSDRAVELLTMLDEWSGENERGRQRVGVIGFLEIGSTLWRAMPSEDGTEVWWPSLLALTDTTYGPSPARELVVGMWRRVLMAPRVDAFVIRVLRRWARAAEGDTAMRDCFVRLFVDVARSGDRYAKLVSSHAKTWRDDEVAAPDTAERLLEMLMRKDSPGDLI